MCSTFIMGQDISREFSKIQQPLSCCAPCNVDSKNGRGEVEDFRKVQTTEEVGCFTTQTLFAVVAVVVLVLVLFVVVEKVANDLPVVRSFQQKLRRKTRTVIASNCLCLCRIEFGSTTYVYINVYHRKFSLLLSGTNDPQTPSRQFTFRNMTRQDYFSLYDAIHTLVRQEEISKEQENTLYDLIGRQDKRLASAYQVTHNSATSYFLDFFGSARCDSAAELARSPSYTRRPAIRRCSWTRSRTVSAAGTNRSRARSRGATSCEGLGATLRQEPQARLQGRRRLLGPAVSHPCLPRLETGRRRRQS